MIDSADNLEHSAKKAASVSSPELFAIRGAGDTIYSGCAQEWFQKRWQRMSGCGPTTAASLFYYQQRRCGGQMATREDILSLMNSFWQHVTPTWKGVYSTDYYISRVQSYAQANGISVMASALDVPKERSARPSPDTMLAFLFQALEQDLPIAFLNHHNGSEKTLFSHHWVVIVSLNCSPDGCIAEFLDQGIVKRIDICRWLTHTKTGGGFVTLRFAR